MISIKKPFSENKVIWINNYKNRSEDNLFEPKGKYNEELFEQFKQFIMFQKMIQNKQ